MTLKAGQTHDAESCCVFAIYGKYEKKSLHISGLSHITGYRQLAGWLAGVGVSAVPLFTASSSSCYFWPRLVGSLLSLLSHFQEEV